MDIKELDRLTALRRAMTQKKWQANSWNITAGPSETDDGLITIARFHEDNRESNCIGTAALVNAFDAMAELARLGLLAKEYQLQHDGFSSCRQIDARDALLEAARRLEVKP